MRQDAEQFASDDLVIRQLVEMKNQADSLLYSYEVTIKENGEFINEALQAEAKRDSDILRQAIDNPEITVEELQRQIEVFKLTLFALGEAVYNQ
ncbi:MAG: Hsp70 family protein, partial [Microcoleaceae cyanobacterium]